MVPRSRQMRSMWMSLPTPCLASAAHMPGGTTPTCEECPDACRAGAALGIRTAPLFPRGRQISGQTAKGVDVEEVLAVGRGVAGLLVEQVVLRRLGEPRPGPSDAGGVKTTTTNRRV